MKKIGYDQFKIDQTKIVEDSKCCLKVNAVISKAGVYLYEDGWALKPKMELLKASNAIRYAGAKLTLHKHPDSKVIMSQSQLYGGLEKPFFERDRIRATLNFDKALTPSPLLQNVRESVAKKAGLDVSIGFYYEDDSTPGFAADVNTGKQRPYDYVMRDILIDHVAVMFDGDNMRGRCTYPQCGIGVDAMMRGTGLDPRYKITKHRKGGQKGVTEPLEEEEVLKDLSEQEVRYPTRSEAFRECVATRVAEGWERGAAEAHCEAATRPKDEPAPPPGETGTAQETIETTKEKIKQLVSQRETLYQKLGTLAQEERAEIEQQIGVLQAELGALEKVLAEQLVKEVELPIAEEDQEVEKTPMERCVAEQVDAGKTEEEAKAWCEAELEGKSKEDAEKFIKEVEAGEHWAANDLINRSKKLLSMKQQRDIERQRSTRRHPI